MSAEDGNYNGWVNYETWCVNLWLSNDEGTYNYVNELAEAAREESELQAGEAFPRTTEGLLADAIQGFVEESTPELEASMFSDLLNAAISAVNWHEIAAAWLES